MIGSAAGFTFNDFLTHTAQLVFFACLATLVVLRVVFRSELAETPKNIEALMHLDENEALRDPASMKKIMTVLGAVIAPFFVYGQLGLAPAFVALGGAAAAPFWVRPDIDGILPDMG